MTNNDTKTGPTSVNRRVQQLAQKLRKRVKGLVPDHLISKLNDEDIAWSYLKCPDCQQKVVSDLNALLKRTKSTDTFVDAATILLSIHRLEAHDVNVTGDAGATLLQDLRDELDDALTVGREKGRTVWERGGRWAKTHFDILHGKPQSKERLQKECFRLSNDYLGNENKKWLFIHSPSSVNELFEVGGDLGRMMVAVAKLVTVAEYGGMIFGADFSQGWGTPKAVGRFTPLIVCKTNNSDQRESLMPQS